MNKTVIALVLGIVSIGLLTLLMVSLFGPKKHSQNGPRVQQLSSDYINQEPSEVAKEHMIAGEPVVNPGYTYPAIPELPTEYNEVTKLLSEKKLNTKKDVEDNLDKNSLIENIHDVYNGLDYHSFTFEFDDANTLVKTYFKNNGNAFDVDKGRTYFGAPEFVYEQSPTDARLLEYVYAYLGVTLLFDSKSRNLSSMVFYAPKSLSEYKSSYEDLQPFYTD